MGGGETRKRHQLPVPPPAMPLAAIAQHAGMDAAIAVAHRFCGYFIAFPRRAEAWRDHRFGGEMVALVGQTTAQAILDDVEVWREASASAACPSRYRLPSGPAPW